MERFNFNYGKAKEDLRQRNGELIQEKVFTFDFLNKQKVKSDKFGEKNEVTTQPVI